MKRNVLMSSLIFASLWCGFMACTATEKAAVKADASELESQAIACEDPENVSIVSTALNDMMTAAGGGPITEAIVFEQIAKVGLPVVSCIGKALAVDVDSAFIVPADGGVSLASADFAKLRTSEHAFFSAITKHLTRRTVKDAGK